MLVIPYNPSMSENDHCWKVHFENLIEKKSENYGGFICDNNIEFQFPVY